MCAAPLFQVGFADFWLADQLNSLVVALLDFQFLICFYVTNGNWLEAGSKCKLVFTLNLIFKGYCIHNNEGQKVVSQTNV